MRIIVSAGGTGGHLYPALALVDYIKLQEPDSEFLFIGTRDRLEAHIVPELGYDYYGLDVKGLTGNPLQKAWNVLKFIRSLSEAKKVIKKFQPDLVFGFGGYPSASTVLSASRLHIKTMIHEQNSLIGKTNHLLVKRADEIICCYEKAYHDFPAEKTKLLGNPRASVVSSQELKDVHDIYGIPHNRRVVVIVMGSLGSESVNRIMQEALVKMGHEDYDVLYATGKAHYDEMLAATKDLPENIHILPYIDDMPSVLSSCDLAVTRAGATTLAELTAIGAVSLIIPSPYVAENHQEFNARELVDHGAAEMILEKNLESESFVEKVNQLLSNEEKRAQMKENAKKLGKPDACQDIYQEILKVLKG